MVKLRDMVKVYFYGMMEDDMRVNMKMILNKVRVHFSGKFYELSIK